MPSVLSSRFLISITPFNYGAYLYHLLLLTLQGSLTLISSIPKAHSTGQLCNHLLHRQGPIN